MILLPVLITVSCSSLQTFPNRQPDKNQPSIIASLQETIETRENFSINVFSRRAFTPLFKQTKLLTHSFYAIILENDEFFTLSFCGKRSIFYSDGIWILNRKTDIKSYNLFLNGKNRWEVNYLYPENAIDAFMTLDNIIKTIKTGAKYYYRDHLKDKPNSLNCVTAINETIVLSDTIMLSMK